MKSIIFNTKIITPSKVVCIGRNYVEHIDELNNETPDSMVVFNKPNSAILWVKFILMINFYFNQNGKLCKRSMTISFRTSRLNVFEISTDTPKFDIECLLSQIPALPNAWQSNSFCTTIVYTIEKGYIMKKAINIRLEQDVVETLDEYAHKLDKTRTSLVEKAIELYFDKLDEMVADKRIDNLKAGKTTVVSLEEVFKKAGINV